MGLFGRSGKRGDHREFAVIGLGRFGSSVALTLTELGYTVVGLDRDPDLAQRYSTDLAQTASLDTTDREALKKVDVTAFAAVIVAIGVDFESSILTTVALKELGVTRVVAKAATKTQGEILRRIGADEVVLPEMDMGAWVAQRLINPEIHEEIELAPNQQLAVVAVPKLYASAELAHALHRHGGLRCLALVRGETVSTPVPGKTRLQAGDRLVLVGNHGELETFGSAG